MKPQAELFDVALSEAPSAEGAVQAHSKRAQSPEVDTLPLCVDLDGTLLKIDSTYEAIISSVLADGRNLFRLSAWIAHGRAHLKRELAARWSFNPAFLPYNEDFLAYLRDEHERGRRLVLATAADEAIARPIARHLGLFDEVIASDGTNNLRGRAKADALCRRFGKNGFVYAGNDATDHAVWLEAAAAIVVNAGSAVKRTALAQYPVALVVEKGDSALRAAFDAMRPYQWIKNLLTFVPLFAAGNLGNVTAWWNTFAIMAAFCAMASAIYVLNDMGDLAADRAHPRKRNRPLASGRLSLLTAAAMIPLLGAAALVLGIVSGGITALLIYAALSLAYTLRLKEMPLIDVFILAALYTIRMFGGSEASGYVLSEWLLGFSAFLFLSLALVKRVSELSRLRAAAQSKTQRRGYLVEDLPILQMFGTSTTFASSVVLSLYVQSETASNLYQRPEILLGLVPLLMFWQCRLWLSTARGYMHDDPIVYAARDWVSWCVFLATAAVLLAAKLAP
jgi:4-hydroxybenzoate polyprenyltransferase/phosphoserine phosphatase